jgi:hypothetical protein
VIFFQNFFVKFISLSLWYIYRELMCIGYVPILFYQMCAYLFLMSKAPKPWSRDVTEKPRKRGSPQLGRPRPSTAPQRAAAARPLGWDVDAARRSKLLVPGPVRRARTRCFGTRSGAESKARTHCFALNQRRFAFVASLSSSTTVISSTFSYQWEANKDKLSL